MAVNEISGFLKFKDTNGDINLLLPITTKDNVDGLDELEENIGTLNEHAANADIHFTADERNKLKNIEADANKTVVDSAMSTSSENPVQNKVLKAYVDDAISNIDIPDEIYVQDEAPANAEEGALWLDTDEEAAVGGSGGANIDVTASVGQTIVVEEVDANGKPTKWKAAEYQERTHWSEDGLADIVPEIPFAPILDQDMGAYMHPLPSFELEDGKNYTVVYDGESYPCTAFSGNLYNMPFVGIGNGAVAGGANTGEPFAVAVLSTVSGDTVLSKQYLVVCFDDKVHTIRIIENKIVPHKIPDEYVTPSVFFVNITALPSGDYILLTPWEHIIEAVNSDKIVYSIVYKDEYDFDEYGNAHTYQTRYYRLCTNAKVSNSLECSITVMDLKTSGTVEYVVIARDKDGVTTFTTQ